MKHSVDVRSVRMQRGMTLVEVLVGVAIGLIGMIVIFQTVTVWDSRTRATTAGSDSQVTGTIAMYALERDLRLAGQGFGTATMPVMGCQVQGYDANASAGMGFPLVPVVIVDNDTINLPDEIATLHGVSPYFTADEKYTFASQFSIGTFDRTGFKSGDLAVISNLGGALPGSAACRMVEVTDDSTIGDPKILTFTPAATYNHFYLNGAPLPPRFNDATGIQAASFPVGKVFSLGPLPRRNVWNIASGASAVLQNHDEIQASGTNPVAEGVIDLKAEYGFDVDPTASLNLQWGKALPVPGDWTQVRAIRVAMLVRSRNYEKPGVFNSTEQNLGQTNPPVWHKDGGLTQVNFFMRNVDGTLDSFSGSPRDPDPNNWRNYRYTVYEKVFPLRNVIWGQP